MPIPYSRTRAIGLTRFKKHSLAGSIRWRKELESLQLFRRLALEIKPYDADRNDRLLSPTWVAELRQLAISDVAALEERRRDHQQSEIAFADFLLNPLVPILAHHDHAVAKGVVLIRCRRPELLFELVEEPLRQLEMLTCIAHEESNEALSRRHRRTGRHDAARALEFCAEILPRLRIDECARLALGGIGAGEPRESSIQRVFLLRIDDPAQAEIATESVDRLCGVVQSIAKCGECGLRLCGVEVRENLARSGGKDRRGLSRQCDETLQSFGIGIPEFIPPRLPDTRQRVAVNDRSVVGHGTPPRIRGRSCPKAERLANGTYDFDDLLMISATRENAADGKCIKSGGFASGCPL